MELLYEMRSPASNDTSHASYSSFSSYRERLQNQYKYPCAVSVSSKNLIAFTSQYNLLRRSTGRNGHTNTVLEENGIHVYVADLNTPWDCYLVKTSPVEITALSWSIKGELLVASEDGFIGLYEMCDNVLNEWRLCYEHTFPGEPVISTCWLQFPKKVCLNPEKLDSMLYSEKYDIRQIPNKSGFGGKSLEGCLVITSTGLIGAIVKSPEDPSKVITCLESLVAVRSRLTCADTCYSKDGNIFVASSTGRTNQPVQISRVNVKLVGNRDRAEIVVKPAQSLFVPSLSDTYVSSIRFANSTNPETLFLALTNRETLCSMVCLYELVHHPVQLSGRFQSLEFIPTYKWQQSAQVQVGSGIQDMCTVAMPIANPGQLSHNLGVNIAIQPVVAVALSNGSIQLMRQDNLQQIGLVPPKQVKREVDDFPEKKQMKLSVPLTVFNGLRFSWSGSVLVALDNNSSFSIFKMHPNIDASTATSLLELSIVGGFDPWDILICIRQNLVENIVDRLSETFARQPPAVQCYYNVKILVLKAALYRIACGGLARSNDQQTLLTLNLVSGALKALLRPSSMSTYDKGPAESLSALLSSKGESLSDVDQVLLHSEAKKYTVETSTLQSLQPFLQWCADLALKLLAALPDLRHSRAALWEVCRDSKAVGTLRELIVLMRIWGLICKSCLPAFRRTSDNIDVLPMLFRLLTRLSVAPHDPDDTLIDDCCLLPSEVQVPSYTSLSPVKNHGLASSALLSRGSSLQFEYGSNPLKWHVNNLEDSNGTWMDGLRLLWLGKNPAGVKVCNRCGIATLIHHPARSAANRAWDNRWNKCCPCGGHWKIPGYIPQPKVLDSDFLNI